MIEKTPAEIEIEKLEKEIERMENKAIEEANKCSCKDKFSHYPEGYIECKAKLSGLKQGIELTEKKYTKEIKYLEDLCNNTAKEAQEIIRDLKQQLSNQEKEIIEKIDVIIRWVLNYDLIKSGRVLEKLKELKKEVREK